MGTEMEEASQGPLRHPSPAPAGGGDWTSVLWGSKKSHPFHLPTFSCRAGRSEHSEILVLGLQREARGFTDLHDFVQSSRCSLSTAGPPLSLRADPRPVNH